MALKFSAFRYAHSEGHTDVCYFIGDNEGLVTCGSDGDVRFWLNIMDDDPSTTCVAEQATACISKNNKIYVGNDNNTVQVLKYPELDREGIVVRFTAAISALDTNENSNLIVSGACNMIIQITNIDKSDTIELTGHEAPIFGLSLDPKEEFLASSSGDGTIKLWNIKEKKVIHTWNNIVPKCNSFFTAKSLCKPSFDSKYGKYLAYPHNQDIVIIERNSWKELTRLKCKSLKSDINICTSSYCGKYIAGSSVKGEIVVWNLENENVIGYIEHPNTFKITSLVWNPKKSNELAFCDSSGQLGCVNIEFSDKKLKDYTTEIDDENDIYNRDIIDDDEIIGNDFNTADKISRDNDDDDDDNKSVSSVQSVKSYQKISREINYQQEPFQPGSTPIHLQSRFMIWNDIGIVRCNKNDDDIDNETNSNIEVEFHDTAVHHSMHMSNYLKHTLASLSCEALALSCQSFDDNPSKLVVVSLQGWGSGNKEWTIDLPADEESQCVAAGGNFVALATSKRYLRLFTISGVQREVIAIPGSVVAMNALASYLVVAYHNGIGATKDQQMNLMWIKVQGSDLKSRTLTLPLSPLSKLMWIGLTDLGSPIVMDSDGILRLFHRKSNLWRIGSDTCNLLKNKLDHYFITGVSEKDKLIRCILCKGSYYPATSPRPNVVEIPLSVPLCELDSEKTKNEAPLWQIGSNPSDDVTSLFKLMGYFCNSNNEFRVVDLCENIAPQKVIERFIQYTSKSGRVALANKLRNLAEEKNKKLDEINDDEEEDMFAGMDEGVNNIQEEVINPAPMNIPQTPEIDIRPSMFSSNKKKNPFLKKKTSSPSVKSLDSLNSIPQKPVQQPSPLSKRESITTTPQTPSTKSKKDFYSWFELNLENLKKEFPDLEDSELTKIGMKKYKELINITNSDDTVVDPKKRKLESTDEEEMKSSKTAKRLSQFAFSK